MSPFASVYGCGQRLQRAKLLEDQEPLNQRLDDDDKTFGPDLLLLFKMHEIWSGDSQENY